MKNFPAAFAAQKNLKKGAAPVWILKLRAGGVDYYISDNAFTITPWAVTTKPWAEGWGSLTEGISGLVDEFKISDFTLTCRVEPGASPNIVDLALTYNLEKYPCYLYLWFYGCADPPQEFFRGYLRDYPISEGDTVCTLQLQDETLKWERAYVGRKITLAEYPDADPDDVGKVAPIVYGSVSMLPALAIDAGSQTSITANLSATATAFSLSSMVGLGPGIVIQIDEEQILINSVSGDDVTGCTRGYNGTLAASHLRAAVAWEQQPVFVYLVADHAVASIGKVYGRIGQTSLDITSLCTKYTGAPGSEYPEFPGKAIVTLPDMVTATQAASLTLNDGISLADTLALQDGIGVSDLIGVGDGITISDLIGISDTLSVGDTINVNDAGHGHTTGSTTSSSTQAPVQATPRSGYLNVAASNPTQYYAIAGVSFPAAGGTITAATLNITVSASGANNRNGTYMWMIVLSGNGIYSVHTANSVANNLALSIPITNTAAMQCNDVNIWCSNDMYSSLNLTATVHSASRNETHVVGGTATTVVTAAVTKTGSVLRSGGIGRTGGVTRTGAVTKTGAATKTGTVTKTGSITKTGTVTLSGNSVANTMIAETVLVDVTRDITAPSAVVSDILATWCGVSSFQQVGSFPASYAFNGAITEYRLAREIIHELAWQCRSWFRHSMGSARLIVRTLSPVPVKTLAACRVESGKKVHSRGKSEYGEIINVINLLYGRDWAQSKGDTAYTKIVSGSDAASIADYGAQERPDLFMMDFVTDQSMAEDLLAFYLALYAPRHWLHTWETFYYDSELEFADPVALGFAGGVTVQIEEAALQPGSDTIQIKAIQ